MIIFPFKFVSDLNRWGCIQVFIILATITSACPTSKTPSEKLLAIRQDRISKSDSRVQKIIEIIDSTPELMALENNDIESKEKILRNLQLISEYDLSVVRSALEAYLDIQETRKDHSGMTTLFLLNKYLFDIPEWVAVDRREYGGWSAPYDEKTNRLNVLWPFTYDEQRHLKLTQRLHGYMGPAYNPLPDFDWYYLHFELRNKKGA